ncbi:Cna B-type domain-containing protein [Carnobacteriaceae bacterium zg-ZUI240]|nr:Cna B-type domain-containing protein [Carnobacteriaceae bacterium zg-ZUI240]
MGLITQQTVKATNGNELTKVITGISIWDVGNGQTLNKDGTGNYQLIKDNAYRFESQFDLSDYDGKLKDEDYFTFTIPAPITVENTNFDLKDKETDVAVGTAVMTSNGDGQGGTVKVTMKNLAEYLKKKGGNQIQGVKGTFYTEFKVTQVLDGKTLSYPESETSKEILHTISVKERRDTDYTEGIKKENFAKIHGVMKKEHWDSAILNKSGEYIHKWTLRVNTNQSSYGVITLKDMIPDDSAPMQYIPEYMEVQAGYFDSSLNLRGNKILKKGEDYEVEYNSSRTQLILKILNASARLAENGKPAAYNVYYATTSPANGTNVINELLMSGDEKELTTSTEKTITKHRVTRSTKITTGGTIQLDTGYRITLYKEDAETGNLLNGAEFEITSPSGETETVKIEKDGVAQSKVYSAEEVKKGEFTVVETKAPKGYVLDASSFKVTVGENGIIRRVKNTKEKVSIPITKKWEDGNNQDGRRPESVIVQLYANGKAIDGQTVILNDTNSWTAQFENLAKVDDNGEEIVYTVKEVDIDGYASKVSGNSENGYTITNTHKPEVTEILGKKTWSDNNNQDGKRPASITVNLLANGEQVASKEVTNKDNWKYNFTDLPKYANGTEIIYTVEESPVDGYTTTLNGYDITNAYSPEKVEISGTKTWNDNDNQDGKRPDSITINLLADGKKVDSQIVTANNNWTYNFTDIAKYKDGKEIVYTVTEDPVSGYTTTIDGYNITNSYTPATTSIFGTKTWSDNDNQDGKRPDSITINLLANGKKVDTQKVSAATNWTYHFDNLPQYENGQVIIYTVSENVVVGYNTSINGYNITNSYTPETVDVKVTKNWEDNDNQDGKRPTSITVNLLADGEKIGNQKVSAMADGTWTVSFTNLPKYKDGKEIKYTVTEELVAEYKTIIHDFTITNKYIPKTIEYKVTKVWKDNNNQDGKRPSDITIQLYKSVGGAEPTPIARKILTLTADNRINENMWEASFTNLPQFEKGQEIAYSVQEVDTPEGYTALVEGQTITNSHNPETIVIFGQKKWDDNNDQDGIRPENIMVELLANGEATGKTATASEATSWQYSFENLHRYKDGKEINYSVKEVGIPKGYKVEVDGMNVTNNHVPETISLTGQKTWDDNNDQDGIRPQSITLHLLANSVDTGLTTTATADTNWTYSFKDIDKYKNGKEITYTVSEDTVDGYTSVVDGINVTNKHTPTTPTTRKSDKPKQSSQLPATGDKSGSKLIILGIVLIIETISGVIYYKSRKM